MDFASDFFGCWGRNSSSSSSSHDLLSSSCGFGEYAMGWSLYPEFCRIGADAGGLVGGGERELRFCDSCESFAWRDD